MPTDTPIRQMSIVVADDVGEIQQLIATWLRPRGHRVDVVSTGQEAMRLLKAGDYDLIIVDVLMPDGDGLDVIREMKERTMDPRILAISGGGKYMEAPDCVKLAQGLGAHAVLMKPFNEAQLTMKIEEALGEHGIV